MNYNFKMSARATGSVSSVTALGGLAADHSPPGQRISAEVQWRLNSPISGGGYSAYQLVSGSDHVDLFGWGDKDKDPLFAKDASPSGQFADKWKLRLMAQEAAPKEVGNS